jgi:molybdopterin/thiamine biosynthesis adenylyltransferase
MKSMADYSRQLSLQWMSQSRQTNIIQSRVLIFGAGGLGVAAVSYLAGAGVGTITLVDHDRVEASNLHRQTIYRVADIGQYKARMAANYVSERNPNCAMSGLTEFLDLQSLRELFEQHDLVLDCTDDQNFSRLLNALCLATGKPAVFANAVKMEGQLFVLDPEINNPCFNCLWPVGQLQGDSCNQLGVLGPVPGILGSLQALEAIRVLAGYRSALQGRLLHCDFLSYEFSVFDVPKNKTCCHRLRDLDLESDFDIYLAGHVPRIDQSLCESNILVDIRTKDEMRDEPSAFSALHIEALKLAEKPQDFLEKKLQYLMLCSSGRRSKKLCTDLLKAGYKVTACRLN